MAVLEFWNDMSAGRKMSLTAGAAAVIIGVAAGGWWLLSPDFQPVLQASSAQKVAEAVRELEKRKIAYRVADDGLTVEVPGTQLGQAKVGLSGSALSGDAAGFELFNNTDFSTTEFTQKINFQRALQGELARTIGTIAGVSSARVHIVLPDSGFLRRRNVQATAAVNIVMTPGAALTAGQVFGIQKLVASSVPELRVDDIAVIDQDGIALNKGRNSTEDGVAAKGQLEHKREVDSYLEGKIRKTLAGLDPQGEFSVSVDAVLNQSDSKVTTEEVLPTDPNGSTRAGIIVKERQSQRHDTAASADIAASGPSSGSVVKEVEYQVGHRVEQVTTAPGDIQRLSVAVVVHSSNLQTDELTLKNLIANAVGAKIEDGDSVAVIVLPPNPSEQVDPAAANPAIKASQGAQAAAPLKPHFNHQEGVKGLAWLFGVAMLLALAWFALTRANKAKPDKSDTLSDAEVDQMVQRINGWLDEDPAHASR